MSQTLADSKGRHGRKGRYNKFSNCRDWRAFLSCAEPPPAYITVATALKAGHAWLTGRGWLSGPAPDRKRDSCNWLLGSTGLVSGSSKTIGV